MNRKMFSAVAGTVLLAACASPNYTMTPTADSGGSVSYVQGVATIASLGANTVVKVSPLGFSPHGRIELGVAALNKGMTPVNLGYENVSVTDEAGVSLHKLDYAEIAQMARRRAAAAEVALALAGAAAAYGDAYAARSTTYGYVGSTPVQVTTYDPAVGAALAAQTGAETGEAMAQVNANLDTVIANAHNSILQTTTIGPGQEFGGEVIVDPPKGLGSAKEPVTVTVVIALGGDTHTFRFQIARPST